jgi:surface antigen
MSSTKHTRQRALIAVVIAGALVGTGMSLQPADVVTIADSKVMSPLRTVGHTTRRNHATPGQCTDGAFRKFHEATGLWPLITGDAADWDESAARQGWTVVLSPEPRAIVVFERGVQGADISLGHVAWVDNVEDRTDGSWVHITEMNGAAGPGQWDERLVRHVSGMSYILAP